MRILSILFFFASLNAFGATCTTTTRTNYSSGQTLTSTALNADFNQLVTKANAFDGGCVTDGTLEASALNSTDFAAVTNGIHQGCALAYSDANTISVGKCILGVNGNFVKTTAASTVAWGCSGCDAEATSTQYYVYAKTGSEDTTLNLKISTTTPGVDGYDADSNKILGRFYNNSSSAIDQYSIESWSGNGYLNTNARASVTGATRAVDVFSFSYGADSLNPCTTGTCAITQSIGTNVTSVEWSSTGSYTVNLARTYEVIMCTGAFKITGPAIGLMRPFPDSGNSFSLTTVNSSNVLADTWGVVNCIAY